MLTRDNSTCLEGIVADVHPLGRLRLSAPAPVVVAGHRRSPSARVRSLGSVAPSKLSTAAGWTRPPSRPRWRTGSRDDFGGGRRAPHRAVPLDDARTDATVAGVPGGHRDDARARWRTTPMSADVIGFAQTGDGRFISTDGDSAYVVVRLDVGRRGLDRAPARHPRAASRRRPATPSPLDRLRAAPGRRRGPVREGPPPAPRPSRCRSPRSSCCSSSPRSSRPACRCSWPASRSRRRSAIDLRVASVLEMSIYVQNIATMLGLALAIDYSLFIVSRFREELAPRPDDRGGRRARRRHRRQGRRLLRAGGRDRPLGPVAVPGLRHPSIGIGGAIVVLCSVVLRDDVPAGRPRHARPARQRRCRSVGLRPDPRPPRPAGPPSKPPSREPRAGSGWRTGSCAGPVFVLLPTLAFLLLLGTPFLRTPAGRPRRRGRCRPASPAATRTSPSRPSSRPARPRRSSSSPRSRAIRPRRPTPRRSPSTPTRLAALEGVDRVEGAFSLIDPATGAAMTPEQVAAFWSRRLSRCRPSSPPPATGCGPPTSPARPSGSMPISPFEPAQPAATGMILDVRALQAPIGIVTTVGGPAALGKDFLDSMQARAPYAVALTLLASAIVLFLLFGSVVIPIKAVIMTLLSITASLRRDGLDLPGGQSRRSARLHAARLHHRRQPDHHVRGPVRAVDGLRGPAPVADPGVVSADRRQHRGRRRGPDEDRRRHHRRGAGHGHGVRGLRPGRHDHHQEHRRRDGDRGPHRRDDRPDPARARRPCG